MKSAEEMQELTQKVEAKSSFVRSVLEEVSKGVIGQEKLLERLLIGFLAEGHLLLEGLPGLAKTTAVKAFASAVQLDFSRLQFTPDLLPADLLGTQIYNVKTGEFEIKKGPLFTNLVLADEINRAPSKVQSALLEAMQEKQITIGEKSFSLGTPFLVLATQNPLEQEGTYPLPEAQLDRFMFKVHVSYPTAEEEMQILDAVSGDGLPQVNAVVTPQDLLEAREIVKDIYIDEKIKRYIVSLVEATRFPEKAGMPELKSLIEVGASPRASIDLARAAKANAFVQGRAYVTPEDIKSIGLDVLRHRVLLSYEAEAEEMRSEEVVQKLFDGVVVP